MARNVKIPKRSGCWVDMNHSALHIQDEILPMGEFWTTQSWVPVLPVPLNTPCATSTSLKWC